MLRPHTTPLALAALSLIALTRTASAQYYETPCPDPCNTVCPAVFIPDSPGPCGAPGPTVSMDLVVPSDFSGNIIKSVDVHFFIQHTYQADLLVELVSPAGTVVTLVDRPAGFSADNLGACIFPNNVLSAFTLSDTPLHNYTYAPPNVAPPGLFGGGGTPSYLPIAPLSALLHESKAGTWHLRVTDYCPADTGFIRYFALSINSRPISNPTAIISSPAPFSLACNNTVISGTADDSEGSILGYDLVWAPSNLGPWTLIAAVGPPSVVNGPLATFNTTFVPEGWTFVRLAVANNLNIISTDTTVLYVDKSFNGMSITTPLNGDILGGTVCPDGSITDFSFLSYRVDFAPGPGCNSYNPVDPINPVYFVPVINDPLAHWNTTAVPDGDYCLRFTAVDACGNTPVPVIRNVTVDNTPPVAFITSPLSCTNVRGIVTITGTVTDAHLSSWVVQVMGAGSHTWTNIGSGNFPVNNGVLATWNTNGLPVCPYAIRLIASDRSLVGCLRDANNTTEYGIVVNVGCPADFNHDGVVNSQDYFDFLNAYFAGC